MKCIHLDDKVGAVVRGGNGCCNGAEQRIDLFHCRSRQQSADWCVLHGGVKGLSQIKLDSQPDNQMASVAVCSECSHREQLVTALPASFVAEAPGPPNLAIKMWQEIRNRRNPTPGINTVTVVDCNSYGWGDLIIASWIAEGSKNSTPRLLIRATGDRKELAEMLGQDVVDLPETTPGRSEYTSGLPVGSPPMIAARALHFGIKAPPARPTVKIQQESISWSATRQTDVLLYPHCFQGSRRWSRENWEELYWILKDNGVSVKVIGDSDKHWQWCSDFMGNVRWTHQAALMAAAKLVIGNESGPMHLAGTLNRPAIALLGRTTEAASALYPSVTCVYPTKSEVPCAGCWGGWGYVPEVCEKSCKAIQHIQPLEIATMVGERLGIQIVVKPDHEHAMRQRWLEKCQGSINHHVGHVEMDRGKTFAVLLRESDARFKNPRFVETGTIRDSSDWAGTGNSTLLFGRYCYNHDGRLDSVDTNPNSLAIAASVTSQYRESIGFHELTGVGYLARRTEPIDVLYLDSVDTDVHGHAEANLDEFMTAEQLLHEKSLVLIDDTPNVNGVFIGKGKLTVPYMLTKGWKVLRSAYQVLLER